MSYRERFERLDIRLLPAFMAVAEHGSFTEAAKTAAMTQSGVSQHIAKLEAQVGHPLFRRGGGSIKLTEAGHMMSRFIESYLSQLDTLFASVSMREQGLEGVVRLAMPESCLFSSHLSTLLKGRTQQFPKVQLDVRIADNETIYQWLRDSFIDFAFVTDEFDVSTFEFTVFCDEEYAVIGGPGHHVKDFSLRALRELSFVKWQGMKDCYEIWRQKAFPGSQTPAYSSLREAGSCDSLTGAVTMLLADVGFSIMPVHCAEQLIASHQLTVSRPRQAAEMRHRVYIAKLASFPYPERVARVLQQYMAISNTSSS